MPEDEGRLGKTEIAEWNSTPEAEKAPQGLVSDRGKTEGVEGAEGGCQRIWGVGTGIAERGKARMARSSKYTSSLDGRRSPTEIATKLKTLWVLETRRV